MLVSQEEYEKRLSICSRCPHITNNKVPICNLCGCMLKMKARLSDFDCPIHKWNNSVENVFTSLVPLPSCKSCEKRV